MLLSFWQINSKMVAFSTAKRFQPCPAAERLSSSSEAQFLGLLAGRCYAGGSCGVILEFPGEPYKWKECLFLLLLSRKKQQSREREMPLWACQSSAMFTGGPAFTVFEATCKWRMNQNLAIRGDGLPKSSKEIGDSACHMIGFSLGRL